MRVYLGGMVLLTLLPIHSPAQSAPADPPAVAPSFSAADVRPSPPMSEPWLDGPHHEGDRYVLYQATMADFISLAYGVDSEHVQGGPSWLEFNRYDIVAKIPPAAKPADQTLMLKALLAERFHLAVHNGTAPMAAYALKTGKDKPRLKPSDGVGNPTCNRQPNPPGPPQIVFSCHNQTMDGLAQILQATHGGGYLDKAVVDETALPGSFDFDLKWTPTGGRDRAGAASISIFDALQSQLGLTLALETAPRPVLLVDRVDESPSLDPPGTAQALPPLPLPEFEVAVITPYKPGAPRHGSIGGGRIEAHGITLRELITLAWDLNDNNKDAIANEPPWLDQDRWDILGKMSNDEATAAANKPRDADVRQLRLMLQALLADRFRLHAHMEDRPGIAYSLVAVNPKLTPADPKARTRCTEGPGPDGKDPRVANPILNRLVTCQNMTMVQLGVQLQSVADGYIYSTIPDKTGLKGSYNFTLSFSSANNMPGFDSVPSTTASATQSGQGTDSDAADPNGAVSVFDAVRRDLGLKLEKEKRPIPFLVIDHIEETPTPN